MAKKKHKKVFKNVVCLFCCLAMVAMAILAIISMKKAPFEERYNIVNYYVRPGDTLWDLAEIYCSEDDDLREWIYYCQKLNGCESGLRAGETIEIYVSK